MATSKDYFKSKGAFTNIDVPSLEGSETNELTANVAWSTEKINNLLSDYQKGLVDITKIHNTPFINNDPNQRKPMIPFSYTREEIEELKKCAADIVYFGDKYAKLFTDEGYVNVKLRDYQQGILYGMAHHNKNILLASRQIGKCLMFNELIETNFGKCKIGDMIPQKFSVLDEFRCSLYRLYDSMKLRKMSKINRIIRSCVGYSIQLVEKLEFGKLNVMADKFIMSRVLEDTKVKSDVGYVDAVVAYMTKPYEVYEVVFDDGTSIECADDHLLYKDYGELEYAKDLKPGDSLFSDGGDKIVSEVVKHGYKFCMYDVSVGSEEHSFFTSGVLSHNTTTTVIYLLWYLLFNREKNALVVGNKWRTSEEILEKIKQTLTALPFFMKPGIVKNNVHDMTFDNGCRIITSAPGKSAAIGFAINLLYMDEFAHIPSQFIGEFWRSVYPTVASLKDSRIVISSTPNGMNMFYEMWCAAIEKKSGFHPMRVDWWQVPGRDEAWKEKTLSEFSQEFFNQEFNLQFFKGDNLLLGSNELKSLYSVATKYVSRHIDCLNVESAEYKDMEKVYYTDDYSEYMTWHPAFLKSTFKEDMADLKYCDDTFVLSIDTSKGQGDDYHILNVFKVSKMSKSMLYANRNNILDERDIFTLVQVGKLRINNVNIETFSNIVVSVVFDLFNYEKVYIALEINQQGILVRNALEHHSDFWNGMIIYTRRSENSKFEPGIDLTGNKIKNEMCESFKHRITTQRIIPTCEDTYMELSNFGTNEKGTVYRCQTGHDDLAITCIHSSVFFDSFQYDDVCMEKFDDITDKEYLHVLNDDIIEYNRKRLGNDDEGSFDSSFISFLNS